MSRLARVQRRTKETSIDATLAIDGVGKFEGATGIGFFDHMLATLARHALFDLKLECTGDLHIDQHHTVEDVGLVIGDALRQGLGDKRGIRRFGHFYAPLDEALSRAVVDLSGRAFLVFTTPALPANIGGFETVLLTDFLQALTQAGAFNLHAETFGFRNPHHAIESLFKAMAGALRMAVAIEARVDGVPSTKGVL